MGFRAWGFWGLCHNHNKEPPNSTGKYLGSSKTTTAVQQLIPWFPEVCRVGELFPPVPSANSRPFSRLWSPAARVNASWRNKGSIKASGYATRIVSRITAAQIISENERRDMTSSAQFLEDDIIAPEEMQFNGTVMHPRSGAELRCTLFKCLEKSNEG